MKLSTEVKEAAVSLTNANKQLFEIIENGYLVPVLTSTEMITCKYPDMSSVLSLFEVECEELKNQGIEKEHISALEHNIISSLYYVENYDYFNSKVRVQTPFFTNKAQLKMFFELIMSCSNVLVDKDYQQLTQSLHVILNANKRANDLKPFSYKQQLQMFAVGFCMNMNKIVQKTNGNNVKETIYNLVSALKTSAQNEKGTHGEAYLDIVREIIKFQYDKDRDTKRELLIGVPLN